MSQSAISAFVSSINQAHESVQIIRAAIDNHLDTNPDSINWANVGDAQRLVADLAEIVEYLKR